MESLQANIVEPATRADPSVATERYEDWRNRFIAERLRVLYIVGLVVNPIFITLDYLAHPEHLVELLVVRAILESGLALGYLGLRVQVALIKPQILLALWVLLPNILIVHMILIQGEHTLTYYNGLGLVMLTAAVIVPVSWRSHLVAQIGTLTYYYSALFVQGTLLRDTRLLSESVFILVFVCVALQISVILYERLQRAEFRARQAEGRARAELEASNAKLRELDRLKSEFFANISHELRTPLTLILGSFKTLLKSSPTPEHQELIQSGLRNAGRLLFLINELLDLARFDSGRAEMRKQWFDMAALVRSVAANFDSSASRRVHLRGVTRPVPIEADPRQLKKVLYNLLSNAFKFSDAAEGRVWIRVGAHGEAVEVEVEDNGIGISSDQLGGIFDRFTQVEGSATRRFEGSGIGLALVKEIVTLHRGTIAVESEPGRGSIFTLTLPRGAARAEDLVAVEEDEGYGIPVLPEKSGTGLPAVPSLSPAGSDSALPLILVVDDNADMRSYLERILSRRYRTAGAKDGAEGLDLAKTLRPHLILTDVMMPRMSGYDLLKGVRSEGALRLTPVIFLTARAGAEARIESLEAGADDYIPKPFDEHEVMARVDNLIRSRAQEQELLALQKEKLTRFLPLHLGEIILAGGAEDFLKGHRAEVTVLFIDLRGFTALAESLAPEDLVGVLREYQVAMGRIITAHQGTLERFSGDAMMVFFNDPLPMPNHAEQAVRMGVAMREEIDALHTQWSKRGFRLGAGIGIATGYATLGVVGFEQRQDYAAIGPVTNLAARLCSEAQHGQILISGRTLELVEPLVTMEPVGHLTLKGFQQPVPAYHVIGLTPVRSTL